MTASRTEQKNNEANIVRRTLKGVVVSDKMKDTIVVAVKRYFKHPKYGKYVKSTKRHKAHNPGNTKHVGDTVVIEECKPISKDKHFKLIEK